MVRIADDLTVEDWETAKKTYYGTVESFYNADLVQFFEKKD